MLLYIHIPFCLQKCGYCDFFSRRPQDVFCGSAFSMRDYIDAVSKQIKFLVARFGVKEFSSVYIGGGTPSILCEQDLSALCASIKSSVDAFSEDVEFTIEANPETVSEGFLKAAQSGGANRLSLGIQCADDGVLKSVGRRTSRAQILEAVRLIKKNWLGQWCADFIAGLPFQTKEMLRDDLDFAFQNGAAHISLYALSLEEGTPLAKNVAAGVAVYDADFADELWLFGREILEGFGFSHYEISNFAIPGHESKHNGGYWHLRDYLGAGAGAVGTIWMGNGNPALKENPAQKKGVRFANTHDIKKYVNFWKEFEWRRGEEIPRLPCELEAIDLQTEEKEFLMMGFRTSLGVGENEYRARFGKDLAERLGAENGAFERWRKKNLAHVTEKNGEVFYSLTREGLLFLNRFLIEI